MNDLTLGKMTPRAFVEGVPSHPHNAVLFADQVLTRVSRDENASSESRRIARAELAVRYFLNSRKFAKEEIVKTLEMDVAAELSNWFGASVFADFMAECAKCELMGNPVQQAEHALGKLNESGTGLSQKDVLAVRTAFLPWLTAEGVVPVFNAEGAYLLPFAFGEVQVGEAQVEVPRVLDWTGKELSAWTQAVRSMNVGITRDIKVALERCDGVQDVGSSLMIPVLMGWWRNHVASEERLPRYSPIRFIATGAFVGNAVGEVRTEEKAAKIGDDVQGGFLVRPGNGRDDGTIPVGAGLERAIACIREMAELQYDAEPSNAAKRLEALDRSVRAGRHEGWESLIDRLDRLWKVQDEDLDEEGYLRGLMLRSAARCHAGMTEEALALNRKAMSFAGRNPRFLPQLLRLRIEELVLLEDKEEFARAFALAVDLEKDIDAFAQKENDSDRAVDLKMRYHGTMGQAVAYMYLAGMDGCSPEDAKAHFETAYRSAVELARRSKTRTGCTDETNIALYNCGQDANYLLLCNALNNPGGVPDAAVKAKRCADRNRENGDLEDAVKNDRYRHRFEALGLYRAVLSGQPAPTLDEYADVEREIGNPDCDVWIRATIGKYLGAVAAAQGDVTVACRRFKEAATPLAKDDSAVLKIIQMTIFAEAYRSLRRFPEHTVFAQEMRKNALALFTDPGSANWRKDVWRDWLQTEGPDEQFPGLNYWY